MSNRHIQLGEVETVREACGTLCCAAALLFVIVALSVQ